ncbi:putative phosphorylase superfamily protein [Colletotrichum sublineola]|uniref:Putative phosphorylase superfamily protein n=1 Tax=Colletotrichum sublineola TaxID=1173701 RepID=A0A066Y000_COLSU|nr:putative phosphorylase superfamily protein [Colletotrichum sublineola]
MSLSRLVQKLKHRRDGSTTPQPKAPSAPPVRPLGLDILVEGTDPVVDIVAIHGLNGHREHTWTATGDKHWLRDFLPTDLPNARILCWGYDANTHSTSGVSCQYLYDHARELVADLSRKRELTKSRERPIIFVAHSLGGIIVKSALIHSDAARDGALIEHRSIKTSTHGILFMGTPHQGGNGVQLGRVLVNVASIFISADDHLLKHLERDSEWLQQQLGQYGPIGTDFVTKFAYEAFETRTPFGQIMVVPRASAVVPGQANGEPIAIHADHINMVKFASRMDPSYVKVSEVLQIMAANATGNIQSMWEMEKRVTKVAVGPFYFIPFADNKQFVGRTETLKTLHSMLFHDNCQRVALCGLGGVGKTQVALKLAYLIRDEKPEYSILWLPASSKESFNKAYLAIARDLGIHVTDNEDPKIALKQHLSSSECGKWLLIIDNADDEDILYESRDSFSGVHDYLPQSDDGVVLFTTRYSRVATSVAGGNVVDLTEMSYNEASSFMKQSLAKGLYDDGIVLMELLDDLTHLPIAIAQAAAYMNENRTSMEAYLGLLRNTKQDMIELLSSNFHERTRRKDKKSQHPVATTWFVSFNKIHEVNQQATDLLMFLSCIEPKGIPRSILPELPSEQQMTAAIGTLCAYAFLTQRGNTKVYDMHRLVHTATGIWIERQKEEHQEEDLAVKTREHAVWHVTKVFPSNVFENRSLCKEYMPHALRLLENEMLEVTKKVYLGYLAGQCLVVDGRTKDAIKLLEPVVEVRKTTLDEGHPDRVMSQHALAWAYQADGRVKDAIKLLEQVVKVRKTTLDEGHPSRLTSQNALAWAYQADGRVKDAIKRLKHIVKVRKTTLNKGHPDQLVSQYELARAYQADGRVKDAIKLLEHVVKVEKTTLDEGHPDQLASQHELAGAYQANGRVKDAIKLLEHVVEVHKTTLDEGHPDRLTSQQSLASAYQADGRVKDAIKLLEHVVEVRKTTLDEGHPDRLASQHTVARAYLVDGQVKDAIKLLEPVVKVHKTTLDEGHPNRLSSQQVLAIAYQADGRVKDAIKLLEHVVEVHKTTLDEGHPSRLTSQQSLAIAYQADGRVKDAIKLLEHVVEVHKTTLDEGHPSRLTSQHALAMTYRVDGRVKDAIKLLEHVVEVRKTTLDEGHPDRLASQQSLASAYQADGQVKEAMS